MKSGFFCVAEVAPDPPASRTPSARDPKRPSREFLCTIYFVAPVLSVSSAVALAAFAADTVSFTMVWTICRSALL